MASACSAACIQWHLYHLPTSAPILATGPHAGRPCPARAAAGGHPELQVACLLSVCMRNLHNL